MESLAKVTHTKTTKEKPTKERYFLLDIQRIKTLKNATTRARFITGAHENAHAREHFARATEDGGKTQHRRGCRLTTD